MVAGLGSITLIHLVETHQLYIQSISETWNEIQNAPVELKEVGRKTGTLCTIVESLLRQLNDGNTIISGRVCEESAAIERFLRGSVENLVILMIMQESYSIKLPNGKRSWTSWFQQSGNLNSMSWTKGNGNAATFLTMLTRDIGFMERIALAIQMGDLNTLRLSLADVDNVTNLIDHTEIMQSCQQGVVHLANPANIARGLPEEHESNVGILEPPPRYSARPYQEHVGLGARALTSTTSSYSDSRGEATRTAKLTDQSVTKYPFILSKKFDNFFKLDVHGAAATNKVEALKALLQNGDRDIDEKKRGWTALGLAARAGYIETVEVLLSWGANVNLQMNRGMGLAAGGGTPLHWASGRGYLDVVKVLLEKGADIEAMNEGSIFGDDSGTPLMLAARSGKIGTMDFLLTRGANIRATDGQGNTALYHAVASNQFKAAGILMEEGADVNHGNKDGDTALHSAAGYGRLEMLNMLITSGAEVNKKNRWGQGAIHRAAEEGQKASMVVLRNAGACQ